MSASLSTAGTTLSLNDTAGQDAETRAAIYEFRVINMVILSLAVCALAVSAAVCCVSYYSRRRCAHVSESVMGKEVRRTSWGSWKPLSLFRRKEPKQDNSRIYYIYSNPLPVGHLDDEPLAPPTTTTHSPPTVKDHTDDPENSIILDPPTFYMQL